MNEISTGASIVSERQRRIDTTISSNQGGARFFPIALLAAATIALAVFIQLDRRAGTAPHGQRAERTGQARPRLVDRRPASDGHSGVGSLPLAGHPSRRPAIDLPPQREPLFDAGYEPDYDKDDLAEVREYRDVILTSPDAEERETALMMLSGNEHPQAVETFVAALADSDVEVRLAAVEALDDEDDLNPNLLAAALDDPDAEVRYAAVEAIGSRDGSQIYALVSRALGDPDEDVRELAEALLPDP